MGRGELFFFFFFFLAFFSLVVGRGSCSGCKSSWFMGVLARVRLMCTRFAWRTTLGAVVSLEDDGPSTLTAGVHVTL